MGPEYIWIIPAAFIYGAGVVAAMFVLFIVDFNNEHPIRNLFITTFWPFVWLWLIGRYFYDMARNRL